MTPIELRDILQTDLIDLLGTYTTPSGKVYPAIRIYPPRVDQSWQVKGIELMIYETPDNTGTIPLVGEKLSIDWWVIKLVQWDETKGLAEIINRVSTFFPRVKVVSKPSTITDFQSAMISVWIPQFLGESRCLQ